MPRLTPTQKVLREIQKKGNLKALIDHEDLEDLTVTINIQVESSIEDPRDEMSYSLEINFDATQDKDDNLGRLAITVLNIALSEQTLARKLDNGTPYDLTFSAETEEDYDEWDTSEEPDINIPRPRQPRLPASKPQPSCLAKTSNHRWFKQSDGTFTCEICGSNRLVTQLTKTG